MLTFWYILIHSFPDLGRDVHVYSKQNLSLPFILQLIMERYLFKNLESGCSLILLTRKHSCARSIQCGEGRERKVNFHAILELFLNFGIMKSSSEFLSWLREKSVWILTGLQFNGFPFSINYEKKKKTSFEYTVEHFSLRLHAKNQCEEQPGVLFSLFWYVSFLGTGELIPRVQLEMQERIYTKIERLTT